MNISEVMIIVGARIRTLRLDNQMSQSTLAAKAGLVQATISNLERGGGLGRTSVTVETLVLVAEALNVDVWQLFLPNVDQLPSEKVSKLLETFGKTSEQGQSDILNVADMAARYHPK